MIFEIIVYFFSFFLLLSAFFVIASNNPVHSILFLILVFFNAIGLLIFFNVEFLAMIFLIIYVGAISVLFLFVIMMLNIRVLELSGNFLRFLPMGIFSTFIFFLEIFLVIFDNFGFYNINFNQIYNYVIFSNSWIDYIYIKSNILILSEVIFIDFFALFLISSLILLVAMIGSIILTLNSNMEKSVRKQIIYNQLIRKNNIVLFK